MLDIFDIQIEFSSSKCILVLINMVFYFFYPILSHSFVRYICMVFGNGVFSFNFYTFKNFERSRTSVPVRIPFRFFFIKIKQNIFKNRESGESITVIFQLSSPAFYFLWVSQLLKNVVNILEYNILEYIPVGYSS